MGKSLKGARVSFGAADVHRVIPARPPTVKWVKEQLPKLEKIDGLNKLKREMLELCGVAEDEGELLVQLDATHHAALHSVTRSSKGKGDEEASDTRPKPLTQSAPGPKKFADLVFTNDTATPMDPVRFRLRKHGDSFRDEGWIQCEFLVAPSTTWHGVALDGYDSDIVEVQVEFTTGESNLFVWSWLIQDVGLFRLHQVHLIIRSEGDEVGYDGHVVLWDLTVDGQTVTVPLLD